MSLTRLDWSQHSHIGLDLDETLVEIFADFLRFAHTQGCLTMCQSLDDFTHHDLEDPKFELSPEQNIWIWNAYDQAQRPLDDHPPIPDSQKGVELLFSQNKDCSVITARNGNNPIKYTRTFDWLGYFFPKLAKSERVHFVNHYATDATPKYKTCQKIGVTLMIDDALHNAEDLVKNGITCILLEKPWNRDSDFSHPLLYRVKNWEEIIDSLKKYESK